MAMKVTREDFEMRVIPDQDADVSWLEEEGNEEQLADYRAGRLGFVGIRASVELRIPCGTDGTLITQTVESPGLWGVDDASTEYHKEVYEQECDVLEDMLREMGVLPKPAPEGREALCLARSLVRDMAHGWPLKELAATPEDVVARITSLIGDQYDFATGELRMNLGTRREAALMLFCEQNEGAEAVHVEALDADGLTLLDVAEFGPDWGQDRTAAVLEWASSSVGGTVRVATAARTGLTLRDGEEWVVGPFTELPPSFEHDRSTASPELAEAVLALVLARASLGATP